MLDRPGTDLHIPLITDSITRRNLFTARDATDLGNTPAAEVKFNFQSATGQEWEFRSIISSWEERIDTIYGPNLDSVFFPPVAGLTIDQFDYTYESDLFSFELMKRRAFGRPGIVGMFGPRFLSSQNKVTHETVAIASPGGGIPSFAVLREDSTAAKNTLIGLQAGLEINQPLSTGLYISGFAKAGGYYNGVKVQSSSVDSLNNNMLTSKQTRSSESFLGEAGGRIYMDIVPNVFTGYLGYEATWIDGFAAAPEQTFMGLSGTSGIETTNTIFFHGVTFGLKYTY